MWFLMEIQLLPLFRLSSVYKLADIVRESLKFVLEGGISRALYSKLDSVEFEPYNYDSTII
jgi:hypothetical protein